MRRPRARSTDADDDADDDDADDDADARRRRAGVERDATTCARARATYEATAAGMRRRARAYDRARRGGGIPWADGSAPEVALVDGRSGLGGLVPGERFYAPHLDVWEITHGRSLEAASQALNPGVFTYISAVLGEQARVTLLAYARGPDGGFGLEGWRPGENPSECFRDGKVRVGGEEFDSGLCIFYALDSSSTRRRSGVGTLCQWIKRNQMGQRTLVRGNIEEDDDDEEDLDVLVAKQDPSLIEFRALSVVWVELPALPPNRSWSTSSVFQTRLPCGQIMSYKDFAHHYRELNAEPPSVYQLGVHTAQEGRMAEARKLMSKILENLRCTRERQVPPPGTHESALNAWDLDWEKIEETLPPFAQHPSGFSYWILHVMPMAIENDFRHLVLSTDDVLLRLQLIFERMELQPRSMQVFAPLQHHCSAVSCVAEARMVRFMSNAWTWERGHELFPVVCASRIMVAPGGGFERWVVVAGKKNDVRVIHSAGSYHPDYTWFQGYAWRAVSCRDCSTFIGFHFTPTRNEKELERVRRESQDWPQGAAPWASGTPSSFYLFKDLAHGWSLDAEDEILGDVDYDSL